MSTHKCDAELMVTRMAAEDRLDAAGKFIFVLRPETDVHAWHALALYAERVEQRDPQLARDISAQLKRIYLAESS